MVKTIGKLRNVNYTNSSHLQTGTLGDQHHLSKKNIQRLPNMITLNTKKNSQLFSLAMK